MGPTRVIIMLDQRTLGLPEIDSSSYFGTWGTVMHPMRLPSKQRSLILYRQDGRVAFHG